jgi:hypothetical protein
VIVEEHPNQDPVEGADRGHFVRVILPPHVPIPLRQQQLQIFSFQIPNQAVIFRDNGGGQVALGPLQFEHLPSHRVARYQAIGEDLLRLADAMRATRRLRGILRSMMVRTGRIEDLDRSFDVQFWQAQGDEAIFRAGLEMAVEYSVYELGYRPDQLRLERSIVRIGNRRRPVSDDRWLRGDEVHGTVPHEGPGPLG